MRTVVLATKNTGKIRELAAMLSQRNTGTFAVNIVGLDAYPEIGDIEENGTSFAENALIKARAVAAATGLPALADDSGLEVDALNGAPGIYSARYSDEPGLPATDQRNNEKLLAELADIPDQRRTARFRCAIALVLPNGAHLLADGAWEGRIAHKEYGGNGFGYDPLFIDPQSGLHSAQLSPEEKNARSHRALALAKLLAAWQEFWEQNG